MTTLTATDIGSRIREAFPFTVDRFPLTGPDNMRTPHYGLFRSDTGECVGNAVTERYEPHTLDDVCALAEAASGAFNGTESVKAHWRDGHFLTISPTREWKRSVFDERFPDAGAHGIQRESDIVFPMLIVRASYNGRSFTADLGVHRLICGNTLSVPVKGMSISANIRHHSSLREKMDDLIEDMRRVVSASDNLMETINEANSRTVNMADFLREVYPLKDDASKNSIGRHDRRIEKIMRRMMNERRNLGRPDKYVRNLREATAWEAYNAVQGYVQHDASRKKDPSKMDRMILAFEDKAVKTAEQLAFA